MEHGSEIMRSHGFTPAGFVAPAWLMSDGSLAAARHIGFEYTCTLTQIVDLQGAQRMRALTTSQRPQSAASGLGVMWNRMLVSISSRTMKTTRVSIHPNDLREKGLRDSNIRLCRLLRTAGCMNETYLQNVRRMRQQ